jgi:hypothetical protein
MLDFHCSYDGSILLSGELTAFLAGETFINAIIALADGDVKLIAMPNDRYIWPECGTQSFPIIQREWKTLAVALPRVQQ